MPVIPIIQRRRSIPGEAPSVPGSLAVAGAVGEAMAGVGKTGAAVTNDFVDLVSRRNEELRRQNNAFAVLKAQNDIDGETRAFRQSYDMDARQNATDPGNLLKYTNDRVDAFGKSLDEKYLANLTDADQRTHISAYRNTAVARALDHAAVFQADFRKDFARGEVAKATDLSLTAARDGSDWETEIANFREKVGALHATGAISAPDMEEIIVKADRQIVTSYLDGLVARDPETAINEINSGKYNDYLPEADYQRLTGKAESLVTAMKADLKAADAEARRVEKETLKKAQDETGNTFVSALLDGTLTEKDIINSALDPAGENSKQYWLGQLANRRKKVEDLAAHEETANKFLGLLTKGKLTEEMVLKSDLPAAKKEHWIDKIGQKAKAVKAETGWKTDKSIEAGFFARIVSDPESVSDDEILDKVGEGLSTATAKSLLSEKKTRLKATADPARKAAEQSVIENFRRDRSNGLFGDKASPEANAEYSRQVTDFKAWLQKHPDDDPAEYYEKVMAPRKATLIESVLDWTLGGLYDPNLLDPKKNREALRGVPVATTPELTKIINGKTYIKRGGKWYEK